MPQRNAGPVQMLQSAPNAVPPSSLFGLPGVTNWSEQKENLDGTVTTLASASQTDAQFAGNFKQTDVAFGWDMEITWAPTYTAGGGTFTSSAQFPYNIVGPFGLNFQNQFDTMNMPSGFHASLMQMTRPVRYGYLPQILEQNAQTSAYSSQPNQNTATNYTSASTSILFTLSLTPGILFNNYYDLEEDGRLYSDKLMPMKAWVTPQLMSGTNRIIAPRVRFNAGLATTGSDSVPVTSSGGAPTYSGTATLGFRRRIIYQPQGANDAPPVFNWQYARDYRRFSLAGVSSIDLPVPQVGQILSLHYAFWDPTLNTNVGGPIPIANIKELDLIYGSGLFKFQDTPKQAQRRYYRQHGIILPEGVLCHDMAIADDGTITNAMALNTLTTSGPTLHIDFTGSQSATAYVYMLIESLRYVAIQ